MSEIPDTFEAPSLEELNQRLPSYRFETLIAKGGMGAAYRARQISLDRIVCVKILPHEFVSDPKLRASFENEARSMARLNHPNLVSIYDFGDANGLPYLAMSYEPGGSLYYWAYGRQISELEAVNLVIGMCEGLAHAHENGILHCDLKPANILLDSKNQARIADFGLARLGDGNELSMGTPGYTAPEVLRNFQNYDGRSDIYSIGVILYELLVGRIQGETAVLPSVAAKCDSELDKIWKQSTNPNPALRYRSFHEFAEDLKNLRTKLSAKGKVEQQPSQRPSRASVRRPGAPDPTGPRTVRVGADGSINQPSAVAPRGPSTYVAPRKKSSNGSLYLVGLFVVAGILMYKQIIPNSVFPKVHPVVVHVSEGGHEEHSAQPNESAKTTPGSSTKDKAGDDSPNPFASGSSAEETASNATTKKPVKETPAVTETANHSAISEPSLPSENRAQLSAFAKREPFTVKANTAVKNADEIRKKAVDACVNGLKNDVLRWYSAQSPNTREKWSGGWGVLTTVLKGSRLPESICLDLQGQLPDEVLSDMDSAVRKQQKIDEAFRQKMTEYRDFYVKYLGEEKTKRATEPAYIGGLNDLLEKTENVDAWVDSFGVDMKPLVSTPSASSSGDSSLKTEKGTTLFGTPDH